MKKWEYARRFDADVADLDAMGADGWELVSVVFRTGYAEDHLYVFKRPLPEPLTMAPIGPSALPF